MTRPPRCRSLWTFFLLALLLGVGCEISDTVPETDPLLAAAQAGDPAAAQETDPPEGEPPDDPGSGFVWKPISENDGKLVILLPPTLTGHIQSCGVYEDAKGKDLIEDGRFSGDTANGGRAHYRFSKPGKAFDDVYAVAHLKNGDTESWYIKDGSDRVEH